MLHVTDNPREANGFTHTGVFHADDIFSTVFLTNYYSVVLNIPFCVMRIPNWPIKDTEVNPSAIVYDIGMGKFDHHGDPEYRDNGVPYAAFGKLWREFGLHYVTKQYPMLNYTDAMWVAKTFDIVFVQGIDAVDAGVMPRVDYKAQPMSVSTVIANMNTRWDAPSSSLGPAFHAAVHLAESIFSVTIERVVSTAKARHIVRKAIDTAENKGTIITLDTFCPWQEELLRGTHPNANRVLYLLYPSVRNPGSWKWQVVPTAVGSFEQRCHVPEYWCGKSGEDLQNASGFQGATFVHKSGFLGECTSREEAYEMARTIISLAVHRGELVETDDKIARVE